jgi:hypothetical protein
MTHLHESDQQMLDSVPTFLSIGEMLKATPATEGAGRFVYMEASNQARDFQNEVTLQKALAESANYFLKYGNVDLEHYTILGRPNPETGRKGFPDYEDYEIGRPVDVRFDGERTFVKAQINQGSSDYFSKANRFWASITELNPPKVWYPSVGGAVLAKAIGVDDSGEKYPVITKVRWSNIGMSLTPVNPDLVSCSTVPFGVLAKCLNPSGGIDLRKSLEAGYGTDSATLTGGSAIRAQSLQGGGAKPISYSQFRDRLAECFGAGAIGARRKPELVREAASRFGLSDADATRYVERFLDDLKRGN